MVKLFIIYTLDFQNDFNFFDNQLDSHEYLDFANDNFKKNNIVLEKDLMSYFKNEELLDNAKQENRDKEESIPFFLYENGRTLDLLQFLNHKGIFYFNFY